MQIITRKVLADTPDTKVIQIEVSAPEIALKAQAGQFIVLMAREEGERMPLTVVDKNPWLRRN